MRIAKIKYKNSTAFTLVEIMVAVFITSLVSITVISLYTSGLKTFFQITETSKQADEFIVLFTTMEKDISRGGFTHPIRSGLSFCGTGISPENAVKLENVVDVPLIGGIEEGTVPAISSCFDRPTSIAGDDNDIERFKVTYAKGIGAMSNTIFKKIVRTVDCDTPTAVADHELSNNSRAIIHDWLPVSSNVEVFTPVQSGRDLDIFDINITLQSQRNPELRLDFAKRIFAKNKSLEVNAQACGGDLLVCRNAIKPFLDYQISSDTTNWNPETENISGGKIFFESGYNAAEDRFVFPTDDVPITTPTGDTRGTLTIGAGTGEDYQFLINSIKYVYTNEGGGDPQNKKISLILESDTCTADSVKYDAHDPNIYCYIRKNSDITWSDAETAAEIDYYKFRGKLVAINDVNEFNFIKDDLLIESNLNDKIWIGGKNEGGWQWIGFDDELTGGPIVDAITKIVPHNEVDHDFLYYNYIVGNLIYTADLSNASVRNYIIELQNDIRPQFRCGDGGNESFCVLPYYTRTINIADLNLCHRDL